MREQFEAWCHLHSVPYPDKLLDLDDRLWDRDNQRVNEAQQEHRPAVSAELANQQTPTELKATLHAALKVLHGPTAQLPEVARVRAYASDAESPIEDLAVRAVSDLLEALLMWPASCRDGSGTKIH